MTREEADRRAAAEVDHCLGVMKQCAKELHTRYREVHGHEHVISKRGELTEVVSSMRDLLTAINQAQTARPLSVLAAG